MSASLTMLFTRSANPGYECSGDGPEQLLLGAIIEPHVKQRERQSNPMNGQLFMRREQKKKAGGENALPQWTSVILTSLLLYCDVLPEETATGTQTALCSFCMHSSTAQSPQSDCTTSLHLIHASALKRLDKQCRKNIYVAFECCISWPLPF